MFILVSILFMGCATKSIRVNFDVTCPLYKSVEHIDTFMIDDSLY